MAYDEAGPSFPLTAIKKKACDVSEWGQVWKQGKREGQANLLGSPQQDDRAVQEHGHAVQEGWSSLTKVENSSPQSRLNSGAFCLSAWNRLQNSRTNQ